MTHVHRHPPGSFVWLELGTTDQNAAKVFYSSLFGWDVHDSPIGPDAVYSMFKLQGRDVGAAYALGREQQERGVPAHWMLYVAVDDVDASAARVANLHGTVVAPPFDVMEHGRMAVVQDPTGSTFAMWQAKAHSGIGIADVDGTLCWADLSTPDPARATPFYVGLFGWTIGGEDDPSDYTHIANGTTMIAGIPPVEPRPPGMPAFWLPYFLTSDCDALVDKAKHLGGSVVLPPMTIENTGRMAVLADPQGATFALFHPARK